MYTNLCIFSDHILGGGKYKPILVYFFFFVWGLLPYYYLYLKRERHLEVERCQYNNMVEIDRCKGWDFNKVTSNHFTVCEKPFHCDPLPGMRSELCKNLTEQWWGYTEKLEDALGLKRRPRCRGRRYFSIDFDKTENKLEWWGEGKKKKNFMNCDWLHPLEYIDAFISKN